MVVIEGGKSTFLKRITGGADSVTLWKEETNNFSSVLLRNDEVREKKMQTIKMEVMYLTHICSVTL